MRKFTIVVFSFGNFYICAEFGKNRSRNATMIVRTEANRFYNLSHAICYIYVADSYGYV